MYVALGLATAAVWVAVCLLIAWKTPLPEQQRPGCK